MIDQKAHVHDKLLSLKTQNIVKDVCPEGKQDWSKLPCITYLELNNSPDEYADDEEYESALAIKVDVWGKTSEECDDVSVLVTNLMSELDYARTLYMDVVDLNSKQRHKTMRFEKNEILEMEE